MNFRHLPAQLWPVAEAAARFFRNNWGISKFKVEEPIDHRIQRRPTLHAVMRDHHFLCVEVSETPYPTGLDSFVLDSRDHFLPVRLFVALPAGSTNADYPRDLQRAQDHGVGVLEVTGGRAKKIHDALSLSLAGLRPIELPKVPQKYRFALSQAESTFRNGNPAKGCSELYDEIEGLSRKIAEKTRKKGLWQTPKPGGKVPTIDFAKAGWARVVRTLIEHLNFNKCPSIDQPLLGRVLGITPHRNASAHKPKSLADLVRRDKQLRTRFENAADVLLDLIQAAKPLRV